MNKPRWRDWEALAQDYAQYHRNPTNRLCHAFGIPLIMFSVVRWTLWPGTAWPLAALTLPLYLLWNPRLALAMAAVIGAMAWASPSCPSWLFLPMFAAGWVLQLLGHRFEGRSPAFMRNLLHLLVGPLWILGELAVGRGSAARQY